MPKSSFLTVVDRGFHRRSFRSLLTSCQGSSHRSCTFVIACVSVVFGAGRSEAANIYFNNFGTTAISGTSYTGTPTVDPAISSSAFTTSVAAGFTSFAGSSGMALALNNSSGTPTITLTLTLNANYILNLDTASFWDQRSASGAQAYTLSVNGSQIANGTVPTTGANTGDLIPGTTVDTFGGTTGLSTYTFTLGLSGATSTGTFRLDDFLLGGSFVNPSSSAFTYYDLNAGTAGSGVTGGSTGSFLSSDFNTKADGTGTTGAFTNGQTAVFSAGTDAAGSYTVNVDTAVSATGLSFEEGDVTIAHAAGGTLTLTGTPSLNVASGASATIFEAIGGAGFSKDGAGKLTLTSTSSNFTGNVTVNGGILSIASDLNLGAASNNIVFGGGTLQATTDLSTSRGFSGGGSVSISSGKTLTSTGTFATTALTLSDTGTLDLKGATPSVGVLTFSAPGTLTSSNSHTVGASGLNGTALTGLATVNAALSFTNTATFSVDVGAAGEIALNGTVATPGLTTGNVSLRKTGAGTLDLSDNNTGLYRVQIGAASATAPATGGIVNINNPNALGANQLFLNNGTLNATTDLTGANALTIGVSLSGLSNAPVTISGSNIEFKGDSGIFSSTIANALVVNNTTTLSGIVSSSTGATKPGLVVSGSGTLVLGGTAANTFIDPVTVSGATLTAAKATALGATTAVSVTNSGTLMLGDNGTGTTDHVYDGATVNLNGGVADAAGKATFATGGFSEFNGSLAAPTAGLGALTLTSNSILDFGTSAGSAVDFAGAGTYAGGTLFITNYDSGSDHLLFNTSVDPTLLSNIQFAGGIGATEVSFGNNGTFEVVPVPEPATIFAAAGLLGLAGVRERKRFAKLFSRTPAA